MKPFKAPIEINKPNLRPRRLINWSPYGDLSRQVLARLGKFDTNPWIGHGMVVTQSRNTMALDGRPDEIGTVVVQDDVERIIVEAWDISAVHTIWGKS